MPEVRVQAVAMAPTNSGPPASPSSRPTSAAPMVGRAVRVPWWQPDVQTRSESPPRFPCRWRRRPSDPDRSGQQHGQGHARAGEGQPTGHALPVADVTGVAGTPGPRLDQRGGRGQQRHHSSRGQRAEPMVGADDGQEPDTDGERGGRAGEDEGGPQEAGRGHAAGEVEHRLSGTGQRRGPDFRRRHSVGRAPCRREPARASWSSRFECPARKCR